MTTRANKKHLFTIIFLRRVFACWRWRSEGALIRVAIAPGAPRKKEKKKKKKKLVSFLFSFSVVIFLQGKIRQDLL